MQKRARVLPRHLYLAALGQVEQRSVFASMCVFDSDVGHRLFLDFV
jgi:hypothetical protein